MHISGKSIFKSFICTSVLNMKQIFAAIQKKCSKVDLFAGVYQDLV